MPTKKEKEEKSNLIKINRNIIINPQIFYVKLTDLWKAIMKFGLALNEGKCLTENCEKEGIEKLKGMCEECYSFWFSIWGASEDPKPTYQNIIDKHRIELREKEIMEN